MSKKRLIPLSKNDTPDNSTQLIGITFKKVDGAVQIQFGSQGDSSDKAKTKGKCKDKTPRDMETKSSSKDEAQSEKESVPKSFGPKALIVVFIISIFIFQTLNTLFSHTDTGSKTETVVKTEVAQSSNFETIAKKPKAISISKQIDSQVDWLKSMILTSYFNLEKQNFKFVHNGFLVSVKNPHSIKNITPYTVKMKSDTFAIKTDRLSSNECSRLLNRFKRDPFVERIYLDSKMVSVGKGLIKNTRCNGKGSKLTIIFGTGK